MTTTRLRATAAAAATSALLLFQLLSFASNIGSSEALHLVIAPRKCDGKPKHIHIAPGHDASTSVIVSFATRWSVPNAGVPDVGRVLVGTSPDDLSMIVEEQEYPIAYSTTIPKSDKFGRYYSPYQHHFEITGLKPATTYYYRVEVMDRKAYLRKKKEEEESFAETLVFPEEEVADEGQVRRILQRFPYNGSDRHCPRVDQVYSFKTAPASAASKDSDVNPVKFAILGDLGQFTHSIETVEHVKNHANEYDAAVLVGDLAYTEYDHRRWDTFMDMIDDKTPFANMTLAIAAGNHDIEKQTNHREIFESYETRFRMPRVKAPKLGVFDGPPERLNLDAPPYPLPYEYGNSYYSFVFGPSVHIVLNAYSSMEPGSRQYEWFHNTIRDVDRDKTPWVLVTIHTPIYNTYALHKHDPQIFAAREHIEPLLVSHFVNMVFTGHIHAYQRTHNVANNERHHRAPMHVTVGAGGRQCKAPYKTAEKEDWLVTRDASFYGYGSFEIYNRTHAHWKWIPLSKADDHDFNVVQDHPELHLPSLHTDEVVVENQYYMD